MSMIAFKMKYMSFIFIGEALTEREIQMIIDEADVDYDGLIDYTDQSTGGDGPGRACR